MASTVIPPPYKGQSDQFPLITIQSPYAEIMQNFNNLNGLFKLRYGNDLFASVTIAGGIGGRNLAAYGTTALFALMIDPAVGLKWYDVTATGTGTLVYTIAVVGAEEEVHTLFFNGYLFYFGTGVLSVGTVGGGPQYWNGTAWAPATYTWPSNFNPVGGVVHKNRAYFVGANSAAFGYSGIDSISGAITKVDLAGQVSFGANLFAIASLSMTENVTPDNVAAFIFSNGQIIVYGGAYPDSASWGTISKFQVSNLIYNNSIVSAKGDTIIFTDSEILSLRGLFESGYEKEKNEGIGAAIKTRWRQIVAALLATNANYRFYIKGDYDQQRDRLVIQLPLSVNRSGVVGTGVLQLIYDFTLEAWYEYLQDGAQNFIYSNAYFNKNIYFLDQGSETKVSIMKLEGTTDFVDENPTTGTTGLAYQMRTAPLPILKFGASAIDGVEVLCKSDLYPQTNYKFIADLGRQTTEAQPLPDQGSTIAKPMMNVGIQGATATQLDISGTSVSASVGLELYGFNVWYNQGAEGSR